MIRTRQFIAGVLLALVASVAFACSKNGPEAKTTVPIAWRNPEFANASYGNILVIAVASTEERRRIFEDAMVRALEAKGAKAMHSYGQFPDEHKLEKASVLAKLQEEGCDAVLITRLLHVDVAEEYVEGKTEYVPTSNADLYMWDYDQHYEEVHHPGYLKQSKTYNVETTLFDAKEGDKVGYIVSETVDPESVEQIMASVADTAAQSLESAKLIR